MHVLLIDDDPTLLSSLRTALEAKGCKVIAAENGAGANAIIAESHIDIVITDILMPLREGLETISDIRSRYAYMPIIAISGGGRARRVDLLEVALKLGANAALQKPFTAAQLLKKMKEFVSTPSDASG